MKRLEHAPEQSCPLPYFKIHIVGWSYVEQLERILEHLKERTQLEIINKHTRKT